MPENRSRGVAWASRAEADQRERVPVEGHAEEVPGSESIVSASRRAWVARSKSPAALSSWPRLVNAVASRTWLPISRAMAMRVGDAHRCSQSGCLSLYSCHVLVNATEIGCNCSGDVLTSRRTHMSGGLAYTGCLKGSSCRWESSAGGVS